MQVAVPRASATILVLAETAPRFKVLMIKRHAKARFMANTYVFPGGCQDAADTTTARASPNLSALPLAAARVAALRELAEETGLELSRLPPPPPPPADSAASAARLPPLLARQFTPGGVAFGGQARSPDLSAAGALLPYAHWITPRQEKYRYDTWFFVAATASAAVELPLSGDPAEIADVRWLTPEEALALHTSPAETFALPPPTYLTLSHLTRFANTTEVLDDLARFAADPERLLPTVEPTLVLESGVMRKWIVGAGVTHLTPGRHRMPLRRPDGSLYEVETIVGGGESGAPSASKL